MSNLSVSAWRTRRPLVTTAKLRVMLPVGAAIFLSGALLAQGGGAGNAPPRVAGWDAFTKMFDEAVDGDSIVGAGIVLVRDGRVVAHHEHGLADRSRRSPISAQSIYHYGSITKTLTAIAIMQLRDRGRLRLDDRVVDYIPELRLIHDPYGSIDSVTIRMLMSHAAGFQDPTWPYKQGKPWEPFEPTTWNQLVAMMPYQEVHFKPGSRYSYSNPGFIYLGRIIEQLSGDPWESYIQKNIFAPLGMTRSYFGNTPYYLAGDRSHNYNRVRDSVGRDLTIDNGADFDPGITIPNGGWNAPLGDLATYLAFLANATHGDTAARRIYDTVLGHSSLEEMWRPVLPSGEDGVFMPTDSIGLSFFTVRRPHVTLVGHTGEQAGFMSFMYINPVTGTAVVAAFNTVVDVPRPAGAPPGAYRRIRDAALSMIE